MTCRDPMVEWGHAMASNTLAEAVRQGALTPSDAKRFAGGMIAGAAKYLRDSGDALFAAEVLFGLADDAACRVPPGQVADMLRGRG